MRSKKIRYCLFIVGLALLALAGCSGGGGSAGSVATGEKGVSLTVDGKVDAGKSLGKTVGADTDPLSGTVKVLNAVDAAVLGSANIGADGSFSGLTFTLPATKSIIVFRADTNKAVNPYYTVVPIDLSNPPAPGIGASNAITILITQASTNIASVVSSSLGLSGVLPSTTPAVTSGMVGDNALPAGQTYATAAQLVTQYGGQILAYNTSGLDLTGALKETLLPAQDVNTMTADQINNIVLDGAITNVAIPGNNPIVSFQVTNKATGKGIRGLKTFNLAMAQLKPAAGSAPSEWLSYMVASATSRPSTDSGYTVLDNGDGSYTVKLGKDIKGGTGGTVTYNANLTHRVAIYAYITNTLVLDSSGNVANPYIPRGQTVPTASRFRNPLNLAYDFVPGGAAVTEKRDIVQYQACEACHTKLGVSTPHSGRFDTRMCVMCHTSQRKNGQTAVTSTNGAFPAGYTYVADGEVLGEFVTMIHKIHKGEELYKTGYNYANVLFNEVVFPMPIENCRSCHVEDTAKAAQALNWKEKPNRKACGACHDNINFATGANARTDGEAHIVQTDDSACGSCHGATSPYYPDKVHKPVRPPDPNNIYLVTTGGNANTNASYLVGSQTNLPAGVNAIAYDIKEVKKVANATDTAKFNPSITFKFKKNGQDVVFNTYSATGKTEMMDGFVGSPSVYFVWAVPQDGITAPAEFNASANSYIKNLWRGDHKDVKGTAFAGSTLTQDGTMTGPDANGFYTITLTNVFIANDAAMLTGGVGYSYSLSSTPPLVQIDVAKYPYTPNPSTVNSGVGGTGGISAPAPNVWKAATGYTGRREIVSNAKCNACHGQLGVGPSYHAGQRNDAPTCTFCHYPNRATGHTSTGGGGWSVNIKDMIHGIHGSHKRTNPFTYEATTANPLGFGHVLYPAVLNNCEACHVTGMYDFSASVYTDALKKSLLWSTGATGTMPTTPGPAMSPFVTAGTAYGSGFSYNANTGATTAAAGTNLVHSPITAACFSCHDSSTAVAHMRANGGVIYAARSTITAFNAPEQCLICHGPGKVADIKGVHR